MLKKNVFILSGAQLICFLSDFYGLRPFSSSPCLLFQPPFEQSRSLQCFVKPENHYHRIHQSLLSVNDKSWMNI